jgi:hypothetical protein
VLALSRAAEHGGEQEHVDRRVVQAAYALAALWRDAGQHLSSLTKLCMAVSVDGAVTVFVATGLT